ncbi:MAG TPA: hypothetical protein VLL82_05270 [Mycobacterium sp.]|nr:hypothetical protein [Mycobacterium sp.]
MTLPLSAADVLAEHVVFELDCIDRMYCNAYVRKLTYPGGVASFFTHHRGATFASTCLADPISKRFVAAIHRLAADREISVVRFEKGQRKDDVAHEHLAEFGDQEGIYLIGVAQEKINTFRTEKRRNPETGARYPWIVAATALVNQYYLYGQDVDFGPFFIKFSSYFPYGARLCLNGHHWAQRQAQAAGLAFCELDNGFVGCDDPAALQRICDRLSAAKIDAFFRKWLARLPHPFTGADRRAGYRYELSVLQAEFSRTQVLDRPQSGRVFFEQLIRDNLDLGRPDKVSLIFGRQVRTRGRRRTPSRFRTRVITADVTPSIHVDYKHSKIKQYHKLGRAIRTETTINDTRDFAIGKRLRNLPALRQVGFQANRRLLATQRLGHDPIAAARVFTSVTEPVTVGDTRIAGLRFGDPRAMALLSLLAVFRLSVRGFTNRELRQHLAPLLGLLPGTMTAGQATYDLRRLRTHGLIHRIPHTNRYLPTTDGLRAALLFTQTHTRLLGPALAAAADPLADFPRLHRQLNQLQAALDDHAQHQGLAA